MPLPADALTVGGGCNCGAIRYKIDIPALAERPLHPLSDAKSKGGEVRLPFIVIDHCNDCRRATGSILPLWLCTPIENITAIGLPRPDSAKEDSGDGLGNAWIPAAELFQVGPASSGTFLTFYKSSDVVTRAFCGRCGTNLAYRHARVMDYGFPDMLDVVLGTVDRKDLEKEALAPERQLWAGCGIGWIQDLATKGCGDLPVHAAFNVNEVLE